MYAIIHDGPGYMSPKIIVRKNRHHLLNITSFQCLFQLIWHNISKDNQSMSGYLTFRSFPTGIRRIDLGENKNVRVKLSGVEYSKKLYTTCTYLVKSPENSVINATITNFNYTGMANNKCKYGGVALFDWRLEMFEETLVLCNREQLQSIEPKNTSMVKQKCLFNQFYNDNYSLLVQRLQ